MCSSDLDFENSGIFLAKMDMIKGLSVPMSQRTPKSTRDGGSWISCLTKAKIKDTWIGCRQSGTRLYKEYFRKEEKTSESGRTSKEVKTTHLVVWGLSIGFAGKKKFEVILWNSLTLCHYGLSQWRVPMVPTCSPGPIRESIRRWLHAPHTGRVVTAPSCWFLTCLVGCHLCLIANLSWYCHHQYRRCLPGCY